MKKILLSLLAIVTTVAIISCGGSGSPPLSRTGRNVQLIQRFSFLSMCNSGIGFFGFGGGAGGGGGTTGSGTGGGGGGVSSIGGYIRNFGGPTGARAFAHRSLEAGTTGGTNGGGGGGTGGQYFYYDEWLQLWVDTDWTENTFHSFFYVDEAKTQPAGHITSTFAGSWETFPQTYTSDYEFTAGSMAGAHGTYICTQTTEFEGSMTYQDTYGDGTHSQGSSAWTELGSTWQWRWDGAQGEWYQDSGDWAADGTGTYSCSNSEGWSCVWHYNADWSGSAHFEGPDPLLPADMTWTANGHYRIVYANGTVEEWNWEDLWGGEGGSNTTGVGGTTGQNGGGGETTTTSSTTGSTTSTGGTTGQGKPLAKVPAKTG